jgi:hypothetical protein
MSTPQTDRYGNRYWYISEGQLHRTDGPAIEHASGYRAWYQNGQLHREDGPAREYADGTRVWWLNGEPFTFEQWLDKAAATPQHQTLLRLRWSS